MLCKIVSPTKEIYKLSSFPSTFQELLNTIKTRIGEGCLNNIILKYIDADNELVSLNNDEDLQTAVLSSKAEQMKTLKIYVLPKACQNVADLGVCLVNPEGKTEQVAQKSKEGTPRVKSFSVETNNSQIRPIKKSLTSTDLTMIDGLIGRKIQQAVEENVKSLLPGLVAKFKGQGMEEENNLDGQAEDLRQSCPIAKKLKGMDIECEDICHECLQGMENVKYVCLECPDYKCCETCEDKIRHSHPLLKIKISIHAKPAAKSAHGKIQYKFNMNISPEKAKRLSESGVHLRKSLHKASGKVSYSGKINFDKNSDKLIQAQPNQKYTILINVRNIGKENWPEGVKLCCANGIYRNQELQLSALEPGVKQTVSLKLDAPAQEGKHLSQWKLYYSEEGKQKTFGESLFIEVEVQKNTNSEVQTPKECPYMKECFNRRNIPFSFLFCQTEDGNQALSCDRFKVANYLDEIFPGKLEEKIDFVKRFSDDEIQDLSKIVEMYLINLSKVRANRGGCKSEGCKNQTPQLSVTLS